MMENYYRNFYPYRFYSPSRFGAFPYGKENFRKNDYRKNYQSEYKEPFNNSFNNEPHTSKNSEESRKNEERSNPIFEIFGIKLFFDDILLISLIFFLYNEGVKDKYLFTSLILLLLT